MKNVSEWTSEIDGKSYEFRHEKVKGIHMLTVNGVPIEIKAGFISKMIGFDEEFMLDGKEARLVIENNKPSIVVDGVYIQNGKKYIQRPVWSMVFSILCILIPIVSLGGIFPMLLGFVGASLCSSVSKTSLPIVVRIILCIVITLLAWGLWFILVLGVAMMS